MRSDPYRLATMLLTVGLMPQGASALTDEEVFRELRINRINPGARSLALGGAFISLADDATAAQTNPAGIGFLRVAEYFVETRSVDNEGQSSVRRGSLPGGFERFAGTGSDPEDVVSPSFLSAVTVYDKWAMGLSVQELVNVKDSTVSTFSLTSSVPETFFSLQSGSIDIDVVNVNASIGVRISDRLGFGGTMTYSRLDVRSDVVNTLVDTNGSVVGRPVTQPRLDLETSIDDTDDDVVFSLGLLYKRGKWHVGAVYRHGPDFTVTERILPGGFDFKGVSDRLGSRFSNRFHLPDIFGVGASWQPSDRTTVAADVEWIRHSNLADGFVSGVNVLTDDEWRFDVDDAADLHLGLERIFFNMDNRLPPMALRIGGFSESDNTIEPKSTGSATLAPEEVFGGEGRQEHLSVGAFFSLGRYKLDVAADFADTDNEYVVSLIFQGK